MSDLRLGFIGLGALGSALARRLLTAGYRLTVWGRTPAKIAEWRDCGARIAESPSDLAAQCEIVITCVTDTAAMTEIVTGSTGLMAGAVGGSLVLDHSTIHPLATRTLAAALSARAVAWVDAPVSGGVIGAQEGRLIVMVGGTAAALERVRPILECYSARITHMGDVGTGQATKIANQMMIGGNLATAAEALNYVANFGVAAALLPDALAGGWADSAVLQHHARRMVAADYRDEVDAAIMMKDIDIASDMGRVTGSPMPITASVQQLYRSLIANGDAAKGQSGLMWLYKKTPL
ncbi:MAG: NAD(P)-dependent oxidoreductase [Gammaproteobacteria bacterium]|nr:NAD(P)-dependent oxidoreductase [Gammaproteobacteria bacterium]